MEATERRPVLTLPWQPQGMSERLPALRPGECRPVLRCGPQSSCTWSGRLHGELVVLKEVGGAAATSETWVWLLSCRAEAERTVFICQAPASDRDGLWWGCAQVAVDCRPITAL